MAITLVSVVEPALETSNNTTHSITTPAGVALGDFMFLYVSYAGGTTTNSLTTNPVGFTKLGDSTAGGITSTVYFKQNCATTDSSQTTVITTSSTNRVSKVIEVYRGVAASGSAFLGYAQQAFASRVTYTSPVVATTGPNGVWVEFATWSVTGQVANAGKVVVTDRATAAPNPDPAAGLTKTAAHWTGSATTTGNNEMGAAHNLTPIPSGTSVGNTTWTPETTTTAGNASIWTIVLAPITVSPTARPTSLIASTGWSLVGAAASITAAEADDLLTTYAETSDAPAGLILEVKFPEIAQQAVVKGLSKLSSTGGSTSFLIQIRQGASTVICSHTVVVALADGVVDDVLTSTTTEALAITDWTDLRMRWTATAV